MDDEKEKTTTDPNDETPQEVEATVDNQVDPSDALSLTPEEIQQEKVERAAADTDLSSLDEELPEKKIPFIKRVFRRINIYFLIFIALLVVAAIVSFVFYLNSQKAPEKASIESQSLTTEALKQLANTDATVGNSSQTLTIQGNAVIAGQTLTRGDLNVAGNFQTGGGITTPSLTVSGTSNLGTAQINSLQVAQNTAIQGTTTLRDLSVAGTSSFSGAMTAAQITVTRLILSGNATLEIPNHISFTGPTPSRSINNGILGNGGSSSMNGSDTSGTINVNSGNNPSSGCFIRVTFAQAFPRTPRVLVSPVNSAAGAMQFYVERNTTGFSLCSANAPQGNQAFAFDYFVTY